MIYNSEELLLQLERQMQRLKNTCDEYDNGASFAALDIAVVVRVLFHDTANSTSLLQHLDAKNIKLISLTKPFVPVGESKMKIILGTGIEFKSNGDGMFVSQTFHQEDKFEMDFDTWWNQTVYDVATVDKAVSRKDFVLAGSNKDGGAHVDVNPQNWLKALIEGDGFSWSTTDRNGRQLNGNFSSIHFMSLRQIGHELLISPELIALLPKSFANITYDYEERLQRRESILIHHIPTALDELELSILKHIKTYNSAFTRLQVYYDIGTNKDRLFWLPLFNRLFEERFIDKVNENEYLLTDRGNMYLELNQS